jgi:hypothetical protein
MPRTKQTVRDAHAASAAMINYRPANGTLTIQLKDDALAEIHDTHIDWPTKHAFVRLLWVLLFDPDFPTVRWNSDGTRMITALGDDQEFKRNLMSQLEDELVDENRVTEGFFHFMYHFGFEQVFCDRPGNCIYWKHRSIKLGKNEDFGTLAEFDKRWPECKKSFPAKPPDRKRPAPPPSSPTGPETAAKPPAPPMPTRMPSVRHPPTDASDVVPPAAKRGATKHRLPNGEIKDRALMSEAERAAQDAFEENKATFTSGFLQQRDEILSEHASAFENPSTQRAFDAFMHAFTDKFADAFGTSLAVMHQATADAADAIGNAVEDAVQNALVNVANDASQDPENLQAN